MTSIRIGSHVLSTLRALEPELREAGVRHISVFGSVARGEDTASSDVDLALDLAPDRTPPGIPVRRAHRALERETGQSAVS